VSRHADRGQAAVELALALPFLCLLLLGVVQVAVIARDRLGVQLAAREAARAAAVSADHGAAARAAARAVTLEPLQIDVHDAGAVIRATVTYTDHTDVPIIGAILPDVAVSASVAMAVEPP
jgi:Flp pilus assembly protein TadG